MPRGTSPGTGPEILQALRQAQGVGQRELALQIGGAQASLISRFESGRRTPSRTVLEAICDRLALSPEDTNRLLGAFGFGPQSGDARAFGEVLRGLRLRAGLSQTELGHCLAVSKSVISRLERGEARPHYHEVRKLTTVLGDLGGGTGAALLISAGLALPSANSNQAWLAAQTEAVQELVRKTHFGAALGLLESGIVSVAERLSHDIDRYFYLATLNISYADCLSAANALASAAQRGQAAVESAEGLGDPILIAKAHSQLVEVLYQQCRYGDGWKQAKRGVQRLEPFTSLAPVGLRWWKARLELDVLENRTYMAVLAGDRTTPLTGMDRLMDVLGTDESWIPDLWSTKSELHALQENWTLAEQAWREEKAAATALGEPLALVNALLDGIEVALHDAEWDVALKQIEEAFPLAERYGYGYYCQELAGYRVRAEAGRQT